MPMCFSCVSRHWRCMRLCAFAALSEISGKAVQFTALGLSRGSRGRRRKAPPVCSFSHERRLSLPVRPPQSKGRTSRLLAPPPALLDQSLIDRQYNKMVLVPCMLYLPSFSIPLPHDAPGTTRRVCLPLYTKTFRPDQSLQAVPHRRLHHPKSGRRFQYPPPNSPASPSPPTPLFLVIMPIYLVYSLWRHPTIKSKVLSSPVDIRLLPPKLVSTPPSCAFSFSVLRSLCFL
jgi:hypothetical protein